MKRKKIIAVVGTRPDAIKMCPLISELRGREDIDVVVCSTGQHRELLSSALSAFGITPDIELSVMTEGQSLSDITERVLSAFTELLEEERPDAVAVHGDTASAFSAALGAFYKKIPICHIEAGLRTYDMHSPFPEEFYRRAIGLIADYHFAPTEAAGRNLLFEGVETDKIAVTGNTVVDALRFTAELPWTHSLADFFENSRAILLTAHRRENRGEAMRSIFSAVLRILDEYPDVKVVYPVHPAPEIRTLAEEFFSGHDRVVLCQPLDVADFHKLLSHSYLVLTDSGGVQEEAVSVRKPVLVIRNTTERAEGVLSGGIRLVGTGEGSVYRGIRALLENKALYYAMTRSDSPFGRGGASQRIADVIEKIV